MKTLLRNLAYRWSSHVVVRANDDLRRELIRVRAAMDRQAQSLQRGEQGTATHTLDEATAEIRRLTRLYTLAEARLSEFEETVKDKAERIRDLSGRIECQADNHAKDRAEWATKVRALETQLEQARDQIRQLEQANRELLEENTRLSLGAGQVRQP